jgi:hypothetical protein
MSGYTPLLRCPECLSAPGTGDLKDPTALLLAFSRP